MGINAPTKVAAMTTLEPRPYASYLRVSSDDQREKETIEGQRTSHQRYYRNAGIDPDTEVYWFIDDGVSGKTPIFRRPGGVLLRQYIESGLITKEVVAFNVNRYNRKDVMSYFAIEALCDEYDLVLVTIQDGVRTDSDFGRTWGGINALMSRKHVEEQSQVLMNGKREKAAKGRYQGANIPFGFKKDPQTLWLSPDPETALVILEWERMIHAGYSLSRIKNYCRDNHIPSPKGTGKWYTTTISDILKNPALYGKARYNTTQVIERNGKRTRIKREKHEHIETECEPIMPYHRWVVMWERIRSNTTSLPKVEPFALLDSVHCQHCGFRYYAWTQRRTYTKKDGSESDYSYHAYRHRISTQDAPIECEHEGSLLRVKGVDEYVWNQIAKATQNVAKWTKAREKEFNPQNGQEVKLAQQALSDAQEAQRRLDKYVSDFVMKGVMLPSNMEALQSEVAERLRRARRTLVEAEERAGDTQRRKMRIGEIEHYLRELGRRIKTDDLDLKAKRDICAGLIRNVIFDATQKPNIEKIVNIEWFV